MLMMAFSVILGYCPGAVGDTIQQFYVKFYFEIASHLFFFF